MTAYFSQQLINAATVSAIYGLLASSYVLMHAVTQRINLAFGAFAILSGYVVIDVTLALMLRMPGGLIVPITVGIVLGIAHATLAGGVAERIVVRPLVADRSLAMLVGTLGLALIIEDLVRLTHDSRDVWLMPLFNDPVFIGGTADHPVSVTPVQVAVVAVAITLSIGLVLLLRYHSFGRSWRAVSQDLAMAELTGVDSGRVIFVSYLLATANAASAGALLALSYGSVSFYGGTVLGLKTLFVAVIGGLNSVPGAIAGACCLGLLETLWSGYVGSVYRDAAAFALLTMLLILFPQGLFAGSSRRDHDR